MDLSVINEYCLKKQSVLPDSREDSITNISIKNNGLHSARIMTPFMTLCSRMRNFQPEQLISELYFEKKLIKLRCMRTTLHIVPTNLASIFHKATINLRLAECNLFFKRNNIKREFIENFEDLFNNILVIPQAPGIIEKEISQKINTVDIDLKRNLSKIILKYYWEIGYLCYVNSANYWENEDRKYGITHKFYPQIDLDYYNCDDAKEKLIMNYIERFGPVTFKDIVWWSGLNPSCIRNIITKNKKELIDFELNGFEFYLLNTEYDKLLSYRKSEDDWVSLLAYEDPALKGYHESRTRYVDDIFYDSLFNQIGEVRASIILNGKAIGTWEWDKKFKKIKLNYFFEVKKEIRDKIEKLKHEYENILFPNRQIDLWDLID